MMCFRNVIVGNKTEKEAKHHTTNITFMIAIEFTHHFWRLQSNPAIEEITTNNKLISTEAVGNVYWS